MRKLIKGGVIVLTLLLVSSQLCFAEDLKIGYISLAKVFDSYIKVADSNKEMDKAKDEVKNMLENMKKLKDGFDTLSKEAKEERKNQMMASQEEIRKLTVELRQKEDKFLREILKDIETVSGDIQKKKKLTYIIDDRLLIVGPKEMDVTQEVVSLLNERYKK